MLDSSADFRGGLPAAYGRQPQGTSKPDVFLHLEKLFSKAALIFEAERSTFTQDPHRRIYSQRVTLTLAALFTPSSYMSSE